MPKASAGGAKGVASPVKKVSPTKSASKCRGCQAPRYEAPTQQHEAVMNTGVEAGVVLKETKGKAMVDLAMHQAIKEEWGTCNKCWANNDLEGCWYPAGAPPCFWCAALKRPCTLNSTKTHKQGNTPDSLIERNYHQVVLVKRARAVVEKARKVEEGSKAVAISRRSLALPTCQDGSGVRSTKGKRKASLPLAPREKGKKRAQVVSPTVVMPEAESEDKEGENKEACHLVEAIKASKVVPSREDLTGPSCQPEAPQDVGMWQEDDWQKEKRDREEATHQVWP
ncbi:hypothetical protein C0993_000537 [Termitomyces sp. T159_Od127]|nr:hypothetical protein C0993_000537 [Termitomyces sp. T159_Od127]